MIKGWSFVGASMVVEERRRKLRERGREKASEFFLLSEGRERELLFGLKKGFSLSYYFILSYATCLHLSGTKGPTFSLDVTHTQPHEEKNLTFWNAKILPRFACRFSGSSSLCFSAPVDASFRK